MSKFIYLVTPDYLMAIIKEAVPYSFDIKGFSDCKRAYKNLVFTNQSSILGYLMVYEELPEDVSDIVEFINFINLIGDKDTQLLLCVNDGEDLDFLLDFVETDNINFMYYSDYEIMTDLVIRRDLFGSILVNKFNPYEIETNELKSVTTFNSNPNVAPVLPNDILLILSPVLKLDSSERTIAHDSVLSSYKDNVLVHYLRVNRIYKMFDEEVDYSGMLDRVNSSDNVDKVLYNVLCKMILEGC